jgi:hypothetical protein
VQERCRASVTVRASNGAGAICPFDCNRCTDCNTAARRNNCTFSAPAAAPEAGAADAPAATDDYEGEAPPPAPPAGGGIGGCNCNEQFVGQWCQYPAETRAQVRLRVSLSVTALLPTHRSLPIIGVAARRCVARRGDSWKSWGVCFTLVLLVLAVSWHAPLCNLRCNTRVRLRALQDATFLHAALQRPRSRACRVRAHVGPVQQGTLLQQARSHACSVCVQVGQVQQGTLRSSQGRCWTYRRAGEVLAQAGAIDITLQVRPCGADAAAQRWPLDALWGCAQRC